MKTKVLILLFFVPFSEAFSKVYGPVCQWYEDPSTSMAIHWVQKNSSSDSKSADEGNANDLDLEISLSYRSAGQEKWSSSPVKNRQFGNTKNRVYSADLKNLIPDTRYTFKIIRSSKKLGIWFEGE